MKEPDHFSVFEVTVERRGRMWKWSVCTNDGEIVMLGREGSRSASQYRAHRALFLLLSSAPYRSIQRGSIRRKGKHRLIGPI